MLNSLLSFWHWFAGVLAFVVIVDLALVLWRNRAAISLAYRGTAGSPASGFAPVMALGLLGTVWDVAKAFFNVGNTVAAHTTGIVGTIVGTIPAFLQALSNPLAAALVFLLVGAGAGYVYQPDKVRVAIDRANRSADIAIAKGVKLANERADQAIAKFVAERKCPAPAAAPKAPEKKKR